MLTAFTSAFMTLNTKDDITAQKSPLIIQRFHRSPMLPPPRVLSCFILYAIIKS